MKFSPRSIARSSARSDSESSAPIHIDCPMPHAPYPTSRTVLPSRRRFMRRHYPGQGRMHRVTDRATAVRRLLAVPLEDFVAERKRLAKELRDGGDREGAAELAKLPKPSAP